MGDHNLTKIHTPVPILSVILGLARCNAREGAVFYPEIEHQYVNHWLNLCSASACHNPQLPGVSVGGINGCSKHLRYLPSPSRCTQGKPNGCRLCGRPRQSSPWSRHG